MRKTYSLRTFFTMCLLCMVGTLCAWAQTTVTFVAGTDKTDNLSITKDAVTITISGSNPGKLNGSSYYSIYKSNVFTISASTGTITEIKFTCTKSGSTQYGPGCFTTSSGYNVSGKTGTWTGNATSVAFNASTNGVRATKIEVTLAATSGITPPTFSEASKTFYDPFSVTITAAEGADIYYTLNGEEPTTSDTKYTAPVEIPAQTTTLMAIAVKDGKTSKVTKATYTYRIAGDGSFEKPYSPEEIIALTEAPTTNVWVKGTILGSGSSTGTGFTTFTKTNIAIGESGLTKCIVISVPESWRQIVTSNTVGTEIMVYGPIDYRIVDDSQNKGYFGRHGMKSPTKLTGLSTLSIKTQEGYATAVIKAPFFVPEGVECGIVTDAKDNVLTINYKYKAGDVVPAYNEGTYTGTPVIVKGNGITSYDIVLDGVTATTSVPSGNLLRAGEGKEFTAESNYLYYKLAYDDYEARTDLGFYWGAADGGAFNVPEGLAYLAVPVTAEGTSMKSYLFKDAVTGIGEAATTADAPKAVYTIDGRRVSDAEHLQKGLYIVNGKKVIIK